MKTQLKESSQESDDVPPAEPQNKLQLQLSPEQQNEMKTLAANIQLMNITPAEIIQIGFSQEQELQRTLDQFLSRLDRGSSEQVFKLFDKLESGVKDANLPDLLRKIQNSKPGVIARFWGFLRSKNYKQISNEAYEKVRDILSGKTITLAHHVGHLEKELSTSIQQLNTELQSLDELKQAYEEHLQQYAVIAAAAEHALERAKSDYLEFETQNDHITKDNPIIHTKLQDLRQKLQLLESRTLSLVGAYMRMPADHIIIQQIEQAGVATLQETTITASSRFASIKTTLLAVNGAFNVNAVQKIADRQAKMDRQLQQVRSQVTKEIMTSAIASPGDNRLEQAAQIESIIADANEIKALMKKAQEINDQKFKTARTRFEAVRQQLTAQ